MKDSGQICQERLVTSLDEIAYTIGIYEYESSGNSIENHYQTARIIQMHRAILQNTHTTTKDFSKPTSRK